MRRVLLILAIVVLVVGGAFIALRPKNQKLTLQFSQETPGLAIDVFRAVPGGKEGELKSSDKVVTVSSTTTLTLKQGSYRVVSQENELYKPVSLDAYLGDQPQEISIDPAYSDTKLTSLADSERASILAALRSAYPTVDSLFTISSGALYEQGDWYGTTLVSKSQNTFGNDTLRVVLNKQNGTWVVITKPPQLLVSSVDFPDIPKDVVKAINGQ